MSEVKFGMNLRAYRLGWGLSRRHGCYIRMTDCGINTRVELCPIDDVPNKMGGKTHRCWWDDPSILDMLPWLKPVKKIKQYVSLIINDSGEIVRDGK